MGQNTRHRVGLPVQNDLPPYRVAYAEQGNGELFVQQDDPVAAGQLLRVQPAACHQITLGEGGLAAKETAQTADGAFAACLFQLDPCLFGRRAESGQGGGPVLLLTLQLKEQLFHFAVGKIALFVLFHMRGRRGQHVLQPGLHLTGLIDAQTDDGAAQEQSDGTLNRHNPSPPARP